MPRTRVVRDGEYVVAADVQAAQRARLVAKRARHRRAQPWRRETGLVADVELIQKAAGLRDGICQAGQLLVFDVAVSLVKLSPL